MKLFHWVKKRRKTTAFAALIVLFLALNGVAYMHAYAMTHFVDGGTRTSRPERLSAAQKVKVLLTGVRIPKPVNMDGPAQHGLPFTAHRFSGRSNIEYEGWHIPCSDPRGLCILFHGYAGCKSSLLAEAQAWRNMEYETFLIDFRGCGGSSGRITTVGYHEAEDVVAALEFCRRELTDQPIVLYGQSMGAAAVLRAVSSHRLEPRAVIVECPFDRLLSTAKNRFAAMGLPSFPFAELLVFWGGVQHGFSGLEHNPVDYARRVDCPVLLMNGERDNRVTRAQATAIFDNLSGDKQLVIFPETGHESCVQRDPERWESAIASFLDD